MVEDKIKVKMTFVFASENKIIIDHTEANKDNSGAGFGMKMIKKRLN